MAWTRTCMCRPLDIPQTKPEPWLEERTKDLRLTDGQLKEIKNIMLANLHQGLKEENHQNAVLKCFPTYVQDLPNGQEKGKYLGLDLGGTNFRVLSVELKQNRLIARAKTYKIPEELMTKPGDQLFDFIASCIAEFVQLEKLKGEIPLAFTFSFPVEQVGLKKGVLQRWTKGFNCPNTVGKDMVEMLETALKKIPDLDIRVDAILNDTTGTLMSCAWKCGTCKIGLILGTGTNACYVEKQGNAELFDEPDNGSGRVIINIEWGAFGEDGSLDCYRTPYDEQVDQASIQPRTQLFEKMISGMYLGELVRLVIVKFAGEGNLLGGKVTDKLCQPDSFDSSFISKIEFDPPGTFDNMTEILKNLGYNCPTRKDKINIRYICECFSRRAGHLVAAGLAAILEKMQEPRVTIGVDGSVYKNHPHMHNLIMEKLSMLADPFINFDIMSADDGSGRGAGLVAAVGQRILLEASKKKKKPKKDKPKQEEPKEDERKKKCGGGKR